MKKYHVWLAWILGTFLGSCSKHDSFDPTAHGRSYIISTGLPINGPGTLATYYPEDGTLISEAYRLPVANGVQDGISDLTLEGANLYLVRSASHVIEVLDAKTYAAKASITYGHGASDNKRKLIDIAGGKIFVADKGSTPNGYASYLKAISIDNFNQIDSIPLGENLDFLSITRSDEGLLLSIAGAVKLVNTHSLDVQNLFDVGIGDPIMDVGLYGSAVYAFTSRGTVARIQSPWTTFDFDLAIGCYEEFPGSFSGRKHFLFDDQVYFIYEPNPGVPSSPVSLARMSLYGALEGAWEIESSGTIASDHEGQTFLVGSKSDDSAKNTAMLTGFDAFGSTKFKIYLPGTVTKILVTP